MTEYWRELLYPLGFLSSLAFGSRALIQWLTSEAQQKSVVNRLFWQISIVGNITLMLHSLIQLQYHVYLVQGCNALISWRNLNLMRSIEEQVRFRTVIALFCLIFVSSVIIFCWQDEEWFRIPISFWNSQIKNVSPIWHLVGSAGVFFFASRFWVQWWMSENSHGSHVNRSFWWLSLFGSMMVLVYSLRIGDIVNITGPAIGLVAYTRNLMLIRKSRIGVP